MKLLYSPTSPYVRKVIVTAHELGLSGQMTLERAQVSPVSQNPVVAALNPLTKIPTLVLPDGQAIYDSRVIMEYLLSLAPHALVPAAGPARFKILTEQAAADGLMDAALLLRHELVRPEETRSTAWTDGQMGKVRRALDHFESQPRQAEDDLNLGDITLGCALGYLDFRFPEEDWRSSRPALAAFWSTLSTRPSFAATDPATDW